MGKPPALFINRKADYCSGIKKKIKKKEVMDFVSLWLKISRPKKANPTTLLSLNCVITSREKPLN